MKPIPRFHLLRIALLGVPLLFSNHHTLAAVDPALPEADAEEDAQHAKPQAEPDEDQKQEIRAKREQAAKRAEAEKAEAEKAEAEKAEAEKAEAEKAAVEKAAAEKAAAEKAAAEKAAAEKAAAEKAEAAKLAEAAKTKAEKSPETDQSNNRQRARQDERKSNARKTDAAKERREKTAEHATPAEPATPATPAKPATPAETATPTKPARDRSRTPSPPTTQEAGEVEREVPPAPATEPERAAEAQVREATREVERELSERKTKIRNKDEAQAVIEQVLGTESRISRAEILRDERVRPRIDAADRQRRGAERVVEISPAQRRKAVEYFQQRLRGERIDTQPPAMLLRPDSRRTTRVERSEFVRPRYLREGRRYVHYDSRASIPAILLAAEALNRVRIMPAREVAPALYERRGSSFPQAALPPQNYRGENAFVLSYPVNEQSMITSDDILFQQGSTQFADPYSYEIVSTLGDAMKNLANEERFVIEGHASAEGSYGSNMVLSQQRAERIVREMVRRGVSPQRLIPVGYGESEARHPANAAEALRKQDRRVVVFRLNNEPVASR